MAENTRVNNIPQFTQGEDDIAFQEALSLLKPTRDDFARIPIQDAFNWAEVAAQLGSDRAGTWYICWFQSTKKPTIDQTLMDALNDAVYEAAKQSRALLKFWSGDRDEQRLGLALSIWISYEAARKVIKSPVHGRAYRQQGQFYENHATKRYSLVKVEGELVFHFEEFQSNY
ncbi:hypothetical protein DFQ28_008873 [Apophysomyces sp. BC1034]|nr:hypothetical protein DFQ30_005241 [Apophysomyces sp. BC1015]KAG0183384.1 hypothetical protein DFQ29_005760 [Apophysomyces sp. BC1021]KAG0194614.1 hypothetical protein DFQ28_008873 [Apophysomyces sp. BC1034]